MNLRYAAVPIAEQVTCTSSNNSQRRSVRAPRSGGSSFTKTLHEQRPRLLNSATCLPFVASWAPVCALRKKNPREMLAGLVHPSTTNSPLSLVAALCFRRRQHKRRSQSEIARYTRAGLLAHQTIETASEVAFVGVRIELRQQLGNGKRQNPVAQELQSLVVLPFAFFRAFACVRQSALEHGATIEFVAESSFEAIEIAPSSHTGLITERC